MEGQRKRAAAALVVTVLGVVFGDIGTSPLYAMQTVFALDGGAVRCGRPRMMSPALSR